MVKEKGGKIKKKKKSGQPKFKIISKRGTRVNEDFFCGVCGVRYSQGWHYKETTRGDICICYACKELYARGRLLFKLVSVTAFESSRTKY